MWDVVGVLYGVDRTIFLLINRTLQNRSSTT